jgi:hypothetical protein
MAAPASWLIVALVIGINPSRPASPDNGRRQEESDQT